MAATIALPATTGWSQPGFDEIFSDRFEAPEPATCTTANWGDATGLSPADAATQDEASGYRRYGGPCGLRVPLDGSPRYVVDTTPLLDTTYNVRFYAFLDAAGSEAITLLESDDGFDDVMQVIYNLPSAGDVTLRLFSTAGTPTDLTVDDPGPGWHSIEVAWEADSFATIYVVDTSPLLDPTYNVRFYAFLDAAGSEAITLLESDDGFDDVIQVIYNLPSAGDVTLRLFSAAGTPTDLTVDDPGPGWHSIEVAWEADSFATIALSVDGAPDLTTDLDTLGLGIARTRLGNVDGADSGGTINLDDFTSRRVTRPGRLPEGDASGDGSIDIADVIAVADELGGLVFAPGQPDCDENGSIEEADIECLVSRIDAL
ncbi:MAG: hypothetical protein GVY32_11380 [Gammaproteobacteria bacterium]|jgi:hypothetical protein|nr:hypothetical protein [Gammaproteobacteria bacterium]